MVIMEKTDFEVINLKTILNKLEIKIMIRFFLN